MHNAVLSLGLPAMFMMIAGCELGLSESSRDPNPPTPAQRAASVEAGLEKLRHEKEERERFILKIAADYQSGGFTNVNPLPRWTLTLCRPTTGIAKEYLPTRTGPDTPHGGKVYYLWVRDTEAYTGIKDRAVQPIGQTLVKETWTHLPPHETVTANFGFRDSSMPRPGEPSDLFIMTKLEPTEIDSDLGWVYAIVSSDRKKVIESGMIASCIGCHKQTTRDRLYGPEYTWPKDADGNPVEPLVTRQR